MSAVMFMAGSSGEQLVEELAGLTLIPRTTIEHSSAEGGETVVRLSENVRGREVFVVQALCNPVNEKLIELTLIISALRRASARRICAIVPYFAYGRQTRKTSGRCPISASDASGLLEEAGVDQVITVDIHCGQIEGFFSPRCSLDNLSMVGAAARFLWERGLRKPVMVAPHATGVTRAKELLDALSELSIKEAAAQPCMPTMAMLLPAGDARDTETPSRKRLELIGDVKGCDTIIVDDIIDSGWTVRRSCTALVNAGAARVFVFATHGVFSGNAVDVIAETSAEAVIVTNSLPSTVPKDHPLRRKLHVLSVAPVVAHHVCSLVGLPPPHLDPTKPIYTRHSITRNDARSRPSPKTGRAVSGDSHEVDAGEAAWAEYLKAA